MRIRLDSGFRKAAVGLCAFVLCCFLIVSSARTLIAWTVSERNPPTGLQRAAHIESENAVWHCELGIYRNVIANDANAAIPELEASVKLNPHSASCWTALGDAYGRAGDVANLRRTLENALIAEPNDARIAFETATIYSNSHEIERALPLYRRVIEKRPDWAMLTIRHAWYHDPNPEQLLANAIPRHPAPQLTLLKLLVDQALWAPAAVVWKQVLQNKEAFPSKDALFYVDGLLATNDVDAAKQVWQQLVARDSDLAQKADGSNLVINAGFEGDILNGGFGWIYQRENGVDVTVDTGEFHSGARSLALSFDTEDNAKTGVKQLIAVEPNTRYSFSAWVRADSVEATNGPRVLFSDARTHTPVFSTEDLLGSSPWRNITGEFSTGPGTKLLELSIARSPANGRIRGKVWVDDLELVRN